MKNQKNEKDRTEPLGSPIFKVIGEPDKLVKYTLTATNLSNDLQLCVCVCVCGGVGV